MSTTFHNTLWLNTFLRPREKTPNPKQEKQTQNAIEIARQGGAMYDKLVAFSEDLVSLGRQMDTAKGSYEKAMNKLTDGTGNLIGRAEKMRKLGLKTTKHLNQKLIDRAGNEDTASWTSIGYIYSVW